MLHLIAVHDQSQSVYALAVDQHVEAGKTGRLEALEAVVQRRITAAYGLQAIEKVHHYVRHGNVVGQRNLGAEKLHIALLAAFLHAQSEHAAEIILRHEDRAAGDGLTHLGNITDLRQRRGVVDAQHLTAFLFDLINHGGRRSDQIQTVLPLQALPDDLHMQHAEETTAEAETQRIGGLGLIEQGGVVQGQFRQGFTKILVLVRRDGEYPGVNLGLDGLKTGQRRHLRPPGVHQRIPHRRALDILDARDHVTHFAAVQAIALDPLGGKNPHAVHLMLFTGGLGDQTIATMEHALLDAHQGHHAEIIIEPTVDDQRLQRGLAIALGRRNVRDQVFQRRFDAQARLGADETGVRGVNADNLFDFKLHTLGIGLGQVHFVQDRHDVQTLLDGRVTVRYGLGFNTLPGIDDQQRPLTGRQRARNFVGKIHVSGGIDKVELIDIATPGGVIQGDALRFDGNAALALDIHGIEHLRLHLAIAQTAAVLNKAIGQRRLAVIDMGDDRKIADFLKLGHDSDSAVKPCRGGPAPRTGPRPGFKRSQRTKSTAL